MKFALSAPSGTGKTTVINLFLNKNPKFELSKSFTTRKSRFGEKNGDEYFFISKEEFQEKKAEMFEYEEIFSNFYGTSKIYLEKERMVIFNVDHKGAIKLKSFGIKTILILPPSVLELKSRLQKRGEENIALRMSNILEEISQSHLFDHILVNDKIEHTVEKIEKIIYENNNFSAVEKIEELKNELRKFS